MSKEKFSKLFVLAMMVALISVPVIGISYNAAFGYGGGGGGGVTYPSNVSASINSGATTTSNSSVTLTLSASNANNMWISNSANFSGALYESYSTSKTWTLSSGEGSKIVYVRFRSSTGGTTDASATITYGSTTGEPPSEITPPPSEITPPPSEITPPPSETTPSTTAPGIDLALSNRLAGRILLQVQSKGEAYYVYPNTLKKYYLGRPSDAFRIMRELGLGATHQFITSYTYYPSHVWGKILIDVNDQGKAYYINPVDHKGYYLGRPADAFRIMSGLGLGITDANLNKIAE